MLVTARRRTRHGFAIAIALNVVAILLIIGWVLSQAYPSTEAVRLRNALLIEAASAQDFSWTPQNVPRSFKTETLPPPTEFLAAVGAEGIGSLAGDWEKSLALARILTRNAKDLGPIQSDLVTTYKSIVTEGRGYCADFTAVYLELARAAGLFAREWGFSFDGFGGKGHTLIEVFDRQRGRWLFLDVYNNVHAVSARTGEPLSALEFRDAVLQGQPTAAVVVRRNGPGRLGYSREEKLLDYYRRGASEWFMWWGNNVFTLEEQPAVKAAARVSRPLEQLVAIAVGVHPEMKVLLTAENTSRFQRMVQVQRQLFIALVVVMILTLVLAWQLVRRLSAGATERSGHD